MLVVKLVVKTCHCYFVFLHVCIAAVLHSDCKVMASLYWLCTPRYNCKWICRKATLSLWEGNVAQCPLQSFWPPLNVLNVAWLLPPSIQCFRQRFEDLDSYLSLLSNTLGPRDAGCLNPEHSVPLGAKWKMLKNQIIVSIHVSRAAIIFLVFQLFSI